MPTKYLHEHAEFPQLLQIVAGEKKIDPYLVEKDYWIMHVLYGLKKQGFEFELKGGTSLSKGFGIINRFSEDIDIHIKPTPDRKVEDDPNKAKPKHIESRKNYYEWLANEIKIHGITAVERDIDFDDPTNRFRSGGIRLSYESKTDSVAGVKAGILLEAGFDKVNPNSNLTISSWAYDKAVQSSVDIIDNRAIDITCYHPGYTFVEKLQTIATKFRQEQEGKPPGQNLMRQYYDVYSLLAYEDVQRFIGTEEYMKHKEARFPKVDFEIPIAENEAFLLNDNKLRERFAERYKATSSLYYSGQPPFDELLARIKENIDGL
ncbi:MAG TPA: nucleotidyl transferase AbiEii/AbiGii toxin family protein [Flavipsychrobacter sp.]|nr:nucleotidyl transferase AbiEii/AbiGii toxin family protein [Flavipsychrobacter sp.]